MEIFFVYGGLVHNLVIYGLKAWKCQTNPEKACLLKKYCFSYYSKSAIYQKKLLKLTASVYLYEKIAECIVACFSAFWSKKSPF